jgi:hypothetical protein
MELVNSIAISWIESIISLFCSIIFVMSLIESVNLSENLTKEVDFADATPPLATAVALIGVGMGNLL